MLSFRPRGIGPVISSGRSTAVDVVSTKTPLLFKEVPVDVARYVKEHLSDTSVTGEFGLLDVHCEPNSSVYLSGEGLMGGSSYPRYALRCQIDVRRAEFTVKGRRYIGEPGSTPLSQPSR